MITKLYGKFHYFAIASLVLGVISIVLVALPFLTVPGIIFGEHEAFTDYMFCARGHLVWPRSLIFSLPGCLTSILVIRRNEVQDDVNKTKVIAGLFLNGFILLTALVLHTFTPILSYPNMTTIPNTLLP